MNINIEKQNIINEIKNDEQNDITENKDTGDYR